MAPCYYEDMAGPEDPTKPDAYLVKMNAAEARIRDLQGKFAFIETLVEEMEDLSTSPSPTLAMTATFGEVGTDFVHRCAALSQEIDQTYTFIFGATASTADTPEHIERTVALMKSWLELRDSLAAREKYVYSMHPSLPPKKPKP